MFFQQTLCTTFRLLLFQIAIKLSGIICGPYLALFLMGMFTKTVNKFVSGFQNICITEVSSFLFLLFFFFFFFEETGCFMPLVMTCKHNIYSRSKNMDQ